MMCKLFHFFTAGLASDNEKESIFHIASAEELILGVCHILFFIGRGDKLRNGPYSLTHFHVKVKGKIPS